MEKEEKVSNDYSPYWLLEKINQSKTVEEKLMYIVEYQNYLLINSKDLNK